MIRKMLTGALLSMFPRRQDVETGELPAIHPSTLKVGRQVVKLHGIVHVAEHLPFRELAVEDAPHLQGMHVGVLRGLLMKTATELMSAQAAGFKAHESNGETLPVEDIREHLIDCFSQLDLHEEAQSGRFISFKDIQPSHDHPLMAEAVDGAFDHAYHKDRVERHGVSMPLTAIVF